VFYPYQFDYWRPENKPAYFLALRLAQKDRYAQVKNFKKVNKRLAALGSAVTVTAEAGRDKQRHKLVSVACRICGVGTAFRAETRVMRLSDITRKVKKDDRTGKRTGPPKSCGCLERQAYARYALTRKRSGPIAVTERPFTSFWTQFDSERSSPLLLCLKAMYKYRPAVPNKKRGLVAATVAKAA
jgi:hypothetical protein